MWTVGYEGEALEELKDELSLRLFGRKLSEALEQGICVRCGSQVRPEDFRDELSKKEYHLSGLCQRCQDEVWDGGLLEVDPELQNYITVTRAKKKAVSVAIPTSTEIPEMPTWGIIRHFGLIKREGFYGKLLEFRKKESELEELANYLEEVEREATEKEDVYPKAYFFERYFYSTEREKLLFILPPEYSWSAGAVLLSELLRIYRDNLLLVALDLRNRGFNAYYNMNPLLSSPENENGNVGVFLFESTPQTYLWLGRFYPENQGRARR